MNTLWTLLTEPSVISAIIGLFAGSGGGVMAGQLARRLAKDAAAREDAADRTDGVERRRIDRAWNRIVGELRDQLEDMRDQLGDRDRRLDTLERRLGECELDRADLRRRLEARDA